MIKPKEEKTGYLLPKEELEELGFIFEPKMHKKIWVWHPTAQKHLSVNDEVLKCFGNAKLYKFELQEQKDRGTEYYRELWRCKDYKDLWNSSVYGEFISDLPSRFAGYLGDELFEI